MDYRKEYEKWLASPALSEDERAELKALEGNDKEIKARFYGPLEFGTAGLRGTMYTGLHNMNRHVIRWATQGFANVIRAEGTEAMQKGVAVCMDCRNHSAEFARETALDCGIPLFENVPLARALWATGHVNDFIPEDLLEPIAEVLKWVKKLQDARKEDEALEQIAL